MTSSLIGQLPSNNFLVCSGAEEVRVCGWAAGVHPVLGSILSEGEQRGPGVCRLSGRPRQQANMDPLSNRVS
jgi:hypothetical protein